MTIAEARTRATVRDEKLQAEISGHAYQRPHQVLSQIRAYLIRRSEEINTHNNAIQLLRLRKEGHGLAYIALGPTIDNGPTGSHFYFDSGARLSFGLTLREIGKKSELVSFRFHYERSEGHSPRFFRFDLNEKLHPDPLSEPRCHLHPGLDTVRIPFSLYDPIAVLDQIFFVVDRLA